MAPRPFRAAASRLLLGALLVGATFVPSLPARGGEFNERDGHAMAGHDAVAYRTDGKPVKGSKEFRATHRGSTFLFATAANRDTFLSTPDAYAPQYGGYCAYGVAGGYKADVDPAAFAIVDGKLYLNYDAKVQALWKKDVAGHVRKADEKWPEVAKSTKVYR